MDWWDQGRVQGVGFLLTPRQYQVLSWRRPCGEVYFLSPQRVQGQFRTKHDLVHDAARLRLGEGLQLKVHWTRT